MFACNLKVLSVKVDNFNDTLKFNDKSMKLSKRRVRIHV